MPAFNNITRQPQPAPRRLAHRARLTLCAGLLALLSTHLLAATETDFKFDDAPLQNQHLVTHPDWFKHSLLDLPEDLHNAIDAGKRGLIVYFGQQRCPYCRKLMQVNFTDPDIVQFTRSHFDVVPIDVWSHEEVTLPDGRNMSAHDYAVAMHTDYTPSLVFYNQDGKAVLRLRGYYPPYQFRAALEYVAGGHYQRESLPVYMARSEPIQHFEPGDLNEEPFFDKPPYNLDRSRVRADRPLAVFFEQGNCHGCDVLHADPLARPAIRRRFAGFDTVQLNMWSDTPVITPQGKVTTARQWARQLGLFYAPSIVFFDEGGHEIIKLDSVTQFFRLRNVLNYVMSKGYLVDPNFLDWGSRIRRLQNQTSPPRTHAESAPAGH